MALSKIRNDSFEDTAVHGRRNLIINGAMQVSQRGTSETGITSNKYAGAPDRFFIGLTTAGTWTAAQSTDAPAGFSSSYKLDCTVADSSLAAGDLLVFQQAIEAQNLQHLKKGTSSAESVTVSFHVKSNKTGTYIAELYDADNTRQISQAYTISSANTWEKKTLTYAGDTTGALNNDNGIGLYLVLWLAAGSSYTSGTLSTSWTTVTNANRAVGVINLADSTDNEWYITGVQLELGEQATPFEHRSFAEELALCQRYLQVVGNSTYFAGNGVGSATISTGIPLATPMRAEPSVPDTGYAFHRSGNTNSGTNSVTNVTYATIGASNLQLRVNFGSGISDEVAYVLNAITADLRLDAEL